MRKLIIVGAVASCAFCSTTSWAAEPASRTSAVVAEVKGAVNGKAAAPVNNDFSSAVEKMEGDLLAAMEAFSKAGKPSEERLKDFDNQLGKIDEAIEVTKEGGKLDGAIDKALAAQEQRIKTYEAKATDPNTPAEMRDRYDQFVSKARDRRAKIIDQRIIMRKVRVALEKGRKDVGAHKQFYLDAIAENDLDIANESLKTVTESMKAVTESMSKFQTVSEKASGTVQE